MTVRVLCLHGMGTDASILRAQLSPSLSLLPPSYSFTFPDAPILCDPSPGVEDFYNGPYRCWFNTPTTEKVAQANAYLKEFLTQSGPFDVVIGFSQGAALAASLLLHQRIEDPKAEPWFKAAIFICSPLPFVCYTEYGVDVRKYFGVLGPPLPSKRPTTVPDYLVADAYFRRNDKDLGGGDGGSGGQFYNMFHPSVDQVRISIPTVHIYGRRDDWRRHSKDLVGLCDPRHVLQFEHDGGHEVPRSASDEICDLYEEVVARAGLF